MAVIESAGLNAGAVTRYGSRWFRADYNFASQGGAVGTIPLAGVAGIPANAAIISAYIDVITPVTSGGAATAALQVESAADVQAAVVVSGAPWSTAGVKLSSARTAATAPIKTTAARDVSLVIAVAALTAGVFRVYVEYIVVP